MRIIPCIMVLFHLNHLTHFSLVDSLRYIILHKFLLLWNVTLTVLWQYFVLLRHRDLLGWKLQIITALGQVLLILLVCIRSTIHICLRLLLRQHFVLYNCLVLEFLVQLFRLADWPFQRFTRIEGASLLKYMF